MTAQACDKKLITFEAKFTQENKNPTHSNSYFANFAAPNVYFLSVFLSLMTSFPSFLNTNAQFAAELAASLCCPSLSLAQPV